VAPGGKAELDQPTMNVEIKMSDGRNITEELNFGEIKRINLPERDEAKAIISPSRGFDVGEGSGRKLECTLMGGIAGVLLDARGRPIFLPDEDEERKKLILSWFNSLDLYPEEQLEKLI
jgi:hypothetical protein